MLEQEYKISYFDENGFVRKQCAKCGGNFWTTDAERETCGDAPCDPYSFIGNPVFSKQYDVDSMREKFLKFFEANSHTRIERYPVVARWRDDIYLTIASIADFQPYVTSGIIPPPANPLTISQPCIRLDDLDSIGRTGRHLSTFEMMAHHAFNKKDDEKYWKNDTVRYCDELLQSLGVNRDIVTYREEPWAGGGNAGACLETLVGGLELATLVFMNYKQVPANQPSEGMIKGKPYVKMDNYIVDTGYGLERFVWASKGSPTIYDAVMPGIVNSLMERAGIEHSLDDPEYAQILAQNARFAGLMDVSGSSNLMALRKQVAESIGIDVDKLQKIIEPVETVYQIADHTRGLAFMLGDGIIPSNAKAGYLARLVIRRTLRHMKNLDLSESIADLVALQIQDMSHYPEFSRKLPTILEILDNEEEKYGETLTRGTRFVEKMAQYYKKEQQPIPTDKLVELYDSHGIPPEISKEVANDIGVAVDLPDNFYSIVADSHMSAQETDVEVHPFAERISQLPKTKRMYYEEPTRMDFEAVVLDVFENNIVLDQTLFYPEGGGQGSDKGTFSTEDALLHVVDVNIVDDVVLHTIKPTEDSHQCKRGSVINCKVDEKRRLAHARHHTATHIVNECAKRVLGEHIWQAGASKTEKKARLDITHFKRITQEQLDRIELFANDIVMSDIKVLTKWMERGEAEKEYGFSLYQGGVPPGSQIRVVTVASDIEACAGTHMSSTGLVGPIKIIRTERIQDGVERIEFAAGEAAVVMMQEKDAILQNAADTLSVNIDQLPATVLRFFNEWKELQKENTRLKEKIADISLNSMLNDAVEIAGIRVIANVSSSADIDELIKIASQLSKVDDVIAIIGSGSTLDGKGAKIVAAAGAHARDKGIHAGNLVRDMAKVVGGGGGGKPDVAQGGGEDVEKLDDAITLGVSMIKDALLR